MTFLSRLTLTNFRCYGNAAMRDVRQGLIVLYGPNGAGKTNVLEAVSLLSPGRGLRGARVPDIQKSGEANPWAVAGTLETAYAPVQLGTGLDPRTEKRTVRIHGETARGQNALGEHLSCVWLTPQMDRLFLDASQERRRFLDRLIFAFDPGHTGRLTRYKNAMSQRSKLLKDEANEPAWLDALEQQMAETGVAIAAARLDFTQRLQAVCDQYDHEFFPQAQTRVRGLLEQNLSASPALEVEDAFKVLLRNSRSVDMLTGGAATGPHKSDLRVVYAAKSMPADQCSTGEQKALLIGLVLAHARLINAERGDLPLLLLDEVAAHLDEQRRKALYELLHDLGGQVWLTGTDRSLFKDIEDSAQFFHVHSAEIDSV